MRVLKREWLELRMTYPHPATLGEQCVIEKEVEP